MARLPDHADAVIIGGGVVGVATAYELAKAGVKNVVLIERDALGAGSTCKAAGGVRAQFSDALNVQLGARSLETFENFERIFGCDIDLHQVGYLFLLDSLASVRAFEQSARLQNSLGIPSEIVSPAEAKKRSPFIQTDGLIAAAWTPRDGHCTPEAVVAGYATAARRAGAELITGCAATGIDINAATINAVHTTVGSIKTDTVICAAGAWSQQVGAWAGVQLPVEPVRRQILITEPVPGRRADTPFTIDQSSTLYFHNEGRGLLMGMSFAAETPGFKLTRSEAWLDSFADALARRAPSLNNVGIASGWAGLYENTPDHNALIGEAQSVSRLLYATGFSGHGFLQAPAVAEVMRDLYLRNQPFVDVGALDARRFQSAQARPEFNIV